MITHDSFELTFGKLDEGVIPPDYQVNFDVSLGNINGDEWIISGVLRTGYSIIFLVTELLGGMAIEGGMVEFLAVMQYTDECGETLLRIACPALILRGGEQEGCFVVFNAAGVIDEDLTVEVLIFITKIR